jgi:hypothetical protein
MKFLALIYADESRWADANPEEMAKSMEAHNAFSAAAGEALVGGEALEPTAAATTVRVRDGERMLTDGPFVETKEQLGGYYVIEAVDLDAALNIAAQIPEAQFGGVEVRPIIDFEGMGA